MEQARPVDRGERVAQVDGDTGRFVRVHGAAGAKVLLERVPANQLHPQADFPIDLVDPIHRHDVPVPEPGQEAALPQDSRAVCLASPERQHFERHFALEPVDGPVDRAESAAVDLAEHLERSPGSERFGRVWSRVVGGRVVEHTVGVVDRRERCPR